MTQPSEYLTRGHLPLEIRRSTMLPGLIMWLLGVPLVVIILLYLFHVI